MRPPTPSSSSAATPRTVWRSTSTARTTRRSTRYVVAADVVRDPDSTLEGCRGKHIFILLGADVIERGYVRYMCVCAVCMCLCVLCRGFAWPDADRRVPCPGAAGRRGDCCRSHRRLIRSVTGWSPLIVDGRSRRFPHKREGAFQSSECPCSSENRCSAWSCVRLIR